MNNQANDLSQFSETMQRQRPRSQQLKLKRVWLAIAVFAVLLIGLVTTFVLSSSSQDNRQQASGGAIVPKEPVGGESLVLTQVSAEIDQFMSEGAQGFLLWHYSGFHPNSGGQWFENDQYSFFRTGELIDDEVCLLLREKAAQYNNRTIGVGVNVWSLGNYSIGDHLRWLKQECGVKTVRVFAKAGQVTGMTAVADAANQAGVQLIIAIGDYSNGGGGMPQAANKQWYQSGYQTQPYQGIVYKTFVQQLKSALANKNVFGYELANEPHCAGDSSAIGAYKQWGSSIAQILTAGSAANVVTTVPFVGFGQMASQQTTRCDSPVPGDFLATNAIPEITMASAHYYSQTEKSSALMAAQQTSTLTPPRVFYVGEASAFNPATPPTPAARYWFKAEVLDLSTNQLLYEPTVACSNGAQKALTISCSSSVCIRHNWKCSSMGAQLVLRSNSGSQSLSLAQLPQGYECVGWKLLDVTNGSTIQFGSGCTATINLPAADWQRGLVFMVQPSASDWLISTSVVCPDGFAPRNYPHKAEWATQSGSTSPTTWQSSGYGLGTLEHTIRGTGPNQNGYIRAVDQQGNYLQPVSAYEHQYFTFGQLFSPARWTAKWSANTPEGKHFVIFRPAASLASTVCADQAVNWNVTVKAVCDNGSSPSQQVMAIHTLWPPNPLQWVSSAWFSGSKQLQISSQHTANTAYLALYASGQGFMQPKTPLPHNGMFASQSFSPSIWLVKWNRAAVPAGNYTISYQAPSSWCSGGSVQEAPLQVPVLPTE